MQSYVAGKWRSDFIIPVMLLFFAGCGGLEMISTERTENIQVDGQYMDWQGAMIPLEKKNVSVGFQHDDQFFYACVVTSDPQVQRSILMRGLVVWLDANQPDSRRLGIKYPLGVMASGVNPGELMRKGYRNIAQNMAYIYEMTLKDLEIRLPDERNFRSLTIRKLAGSGLELATDLKDGELVYEMKIPLQSEEGFPYAMGSGEVQSVKLTLENPEIDFRAMAGGRGGIGGGGRQGGGMQGGDGGMPGGAMGGPGGNSESFKVDVKVKLQD